MFTGIITNIASVKELSYSADQDLLIILETSNQNIERTLELGCSISCNGACLTLIKKALIKKIVNSELKILSLHFQASPETLAKTNIKNWKINDKINLEFALRMGDELGGHLVSGHVDDVTKIKDISAVNNDSWRFLIALTSDLAKFVAPKGSIVLNGVSLTVNEVFQDCFSVNIIKHTFENTNFSSAKIGDQINLEVDLIARYVKQMMS
ncbi:MAG: riboflavin synthase [Rickettsiales bacterium]|jgi:riboflavin synthase